MSGYVDSLGLLDDEEIELDLAALALSELDHEGLDTAPYVALLDEIADRVAEAGLAAQSPEERGEVLAQVIHGEFGFVGDRASYDVPLNADLIRVLDRRRGLPVSLSILYVALARRIGWAAYALNTPGHVLVRIGDGPAALVDPFNCGRRVSAGMLNALLAGALGPGVQARPEHVAPLTNRMVLARLLLNQASRAEGGGDVLRALTVYERMTLVAPENPDGWWELARLQLQIGDVDTARGSLSAMLEVTRDPDRRQLITATLAAIA